MRKTLLSQLLVAAFVPALAWAQAATPPAGQPARPATADTKAGGTSVTDGKAGAGMATAPTAMARDIRVSKLIGMDVRNAQNEDLGDIRDLIVDVNTGRVRYAVLEFGGFLGLGEKLFAYPVQAFKAAADRDELVLNVDRERLKEAPGFERNRWPNLRQYANIVDEFFARMGIGERDEILRNEGDRIGRNDGAPRPDVIGRNDSATGTPRGDRNMAAGDRATTAGDRTAAAGTRSEPNVRRDLERNPNLRRASELLGRDIRDRNKREAGEIEDLVVSMANGRVHYVVVDFDKAWSPDDKMLALPLSALRFAERGNDVTINVTRERLDMSRGFDENQWPDINDARYRGDMDRYLNSFAMGGTNQRGGTTQRGGSAAATGTPPASTAGPGDTTRERAREGGGTSR